MRWFTWLIHLVKIKIVRDLDWRRRTWIWESEEAMRDRSNWWMLNWICKQLWFLSSHLPFRCSFFVFLGLGIGEWLWQKLVTNVGGCVKYQHQIMIPINSLGLKFCFRILIFWTKIQLSHFGNTKIGQTTFGW